MNWDKWVRQIHRWLAFAFTVAVMVNIVALVQKERAAWVGHSALFSLASLMLKGFHMFVPPYGMSPSRGVREASAEWSERGWPARRPRSRRTSQAQE